VRREHTLVRPALTIAALLAVGALVLVTFMGGNGSWTGAGVWPMSALGVRGAESLQPAAAAAADTSMSPATMQAAPAAAAAAAATAAAKNLQALEREGGVSVGTVSALGVSGAQSQMEALCPGGYVGSDCDGAKCECVAAAADHAGAVDAKLRSLLATTNVLIIGDSTSKLTTVRACESLKPAEHRCFLDITNPTPAQVSKLRPLGPTLDFHAPATADEDCCTGEGCCMNVQDMNTASACFAADAAGELGGIGHMHSGFAWRGDKFPCKYAGLGRD